MARVLIIDDNETIREGLAHIARKAGLEAKAVASGAEGLAAYKAAPFDVVLTDLKMDGLSGLDVLKALVDLDPEVPVILLTGFGTVDTAVTAMKLGAFDFLTKPIERSVIELKLTRALELRAARRATSKATAMHAYLDAEVAARFRELIGASPAMQALRAAIAKVAIADTTVFIGGESGTGKELVARAIHEHSRRASGPFIKVNCGALTETLLESELFGHEKGAFTGAIKRQLGKFELADGGTLFLDEVGEVSPAMQAKLLRALQERSFDRVGGQTPISVDVRVVSATNKDLEAEVAAGRFRQDLYYRLHVIPLGLPPLRERRDDIPELVRHFIHKLAPRTGSQVTGLSDSALALLMAHAWPGNVRELENTIEQALVFADGSAITPDALPTSLRPGGRSADELTVDNRLSLPDILEDLEKQLILKAYNAAGKVKTETAKALGIKTSALYYKLEKYGIE